MFKEISSEVSLFCYDEYMQISVLQWNSWYKEKTQNIVTFLKEQNADIICLQELTIDNPDQNIRHAPQYIAEQLGYHYYYKDISFESTSVKQGSYGLMSLQAQVNMTTNIVLSLKLISMYMARRLLWARPTCLILINLK
jgi:endonuclease/exonuclease/phosphatase family metal-dependent hydrolase